MNDSQICQKCKTFKPFDSFDRDKSRKSGHHCYCKPCRKLYSESKKDYLIAKAKEYYQKNREKQIEKAKKWGRENKARRSEIRKKRWIADIQYRLATAARNRIMLALKRGKGAKSLSTLTLLGCSVEYLRLYLESQFLPGMSWDNHSMEGWNIDHIIPCASFDMTDIEQQKKCFNYMNLMPRWATTEIARENGSKQIGNFDKKDKILTEFNLRLS